MKHSNEEIINALNVIKDTCEDNVCKRCPLRIKNIDGGYECYILKNTIFTGK